MPTQRLAIPRATSTRRLRGQPQEKSLNKKRRTARPTSDSSAARLEQTESKSGPGRPQRPRKPKRERNDSFAPVSMAFMGAREGDAYRRRVQRALRADGDESLEGIVRRLEGVKGGDKRSEKGENKRQDARQLFVCERGAKRDSKQNREVIREPGVSWGARSPAAASPRLREQ